MSVVSFTEDNIFGDIWGLSVGASDAGIVASDFCTSMTDSPMLGNRCWQQSSRKQIGLR